MLKSVPRQHDTSPTRGALTELPRPERDVAFADLRLVLPPLSVAALCDMAEEIRVNVGFSRESPPRARSLQHLAPRIMEELEAVRFVKAVSELAGVQLAIHPSAHFGCSFNWSKLCPLGPADAWHLDAAPYTAVILLSEPGRQYAGGELCIFTGDPSLLWESLRLGEPPQDAMIHIVPFERPGEVFLFQGRLIPHSVRPILAGSLAGLTGVREGRLTLAVGLYSPGHAECGLHPGGEAPGVEAQFWHVETLRAKVLASLDRLRRQAGWVADPAMLPHAAVQMGALLDVLEEAERSGGDPVPDSRPKRKG